MPARSRSVDGSPLADFLYCPNGRPINVSSNGIDYGNGPIGDARTSQNISLYNGMYNLNTNSAGLQPSPSILHTLNELNCKITSIFSIDFNSLNDS